MKQKDGSNLVLNPDFAEGLGRWTFNVPPDAVRPVVYAGRTAARCERKLHTILRQNTPITLLPGSYFFEYSAVMEGGGRASAARMIVTALSIDGPSVSRTSSDFFPGHDWRTSGVYGMTLERKAQSLTVVVVSDSPGAAPLDGHVYFTGISIWRAL